MIRVNDTDVEWRAGMTVTQALEAMGYDFPLISVFVNETFVPEDEHGSFEIPDGADVKAIHIHHGG